MAEFVLRDMCSRAGLSAEFDIASAATSSEEIGNSVYPPARRELAVHGIDCAGHSARRITAADYDKYDMIIGMDSENMCSMMRVLSNDPKHKLSLLLDYTERGGEVSDPWYTDDFAAAWRDIYDGCLGLLEKTASR